MRFSHLRFGLLLLGAFVVCSCAGRGAAKKEQTKEAAPGSASANAPAWQTRLGRVVLVNSGLDFVLIDAGTAPVPEPGTRLRAYSGEQPSAELSVSIHQQRPFLIADIISGSPRVSDMVIPVKGAATADEGPHPSKTGRETESLPPPSTDAARKERLDTQELPQIDRRPPPSPQSVLSPTRPVADESQAIIPGLPSSGKNLPR
jgi:hypothetical protein